ncbi:MAG: DNA double-strand break repair nuclease NurA, partial [Caldilineae bacterium]
MLDPQRVAASLEQKRELFTGYSAELDAERTRLATALERLAEHSAASLSATIQEIGNPWPGALPTAELDQAEGLRLAFGARWSNHRAAREWAYEILHGRPVLAVDGSQITPTKDFSVPVGAVQVGWFINEHRADAGGNGDAAPDNYVKDVAFEVLAPDELGDEDDDEGGFPDWRVNQRRFVAECNKLCELMEMYAERPEMERPLCFFDGSFIISFAGQLRESRAAAYIEAVDRLLACSRRFRVPLVGFVDSSYSRDLITLLNLLYPQAELRRASDAGVLAPLLAGWGDRSPLFICARPDQLNLDERRRVRAPFYKDVCFTYMRLVQDRPPARVELPRWILDEGWAGDVLDRVRAECVIGGGYPYAVETADAVAVITQRDRERFYRIFQQFLQRSGLELHAARKMRSKRSR